MNTTRRFARLTPPHRIVETLLEQIVGIALGGIALFLVTIVLISLGYRAWNAGKIFPGVSVASVNLAGLRPAEAALTLSNHLSYPYSGKIIFRDGDQIWVTTPAQVGMQLDPNASAQAAFASGRSPNPLQGLSEQAAAANAGINLAPVGVFDQRVARTYLQALAAEIDRPVREARLTVSGLEISATAGQTGRHLNIDATLILLGAQLQVFRDGEVRLVIQEEAPALLNIQPQVEQARALLNAPFRLNLPGAQTGDPGPWEISPAELAPLLRVGQSETGAAQLELDPAQLTPLLRKIAHTTDQTQENARFTFNDQTGLLEVLQPAQPGRQINLSASIAAIQAAVSQGQSSADLLLDLTQPLIGDTVSGAELGITENIASYTSYFRGSSAARMTNIQTAAARFHGLLVAPGETFSMGNALGDISLDSGFTEALIIYGGRTIKGVGGGVCQVSTTLFRAVFFAGFPVVERHEHAYRVSYYEQSLSGIDPNLAGLDATVYFPLVDFKFTNDTPSWLLMETYFDARNQSLTWKLYSTSDGRSVQWQTTGLQNITPAPPPVLQFNPNAETGIFHQVDWAAEGADITVTRTVLKSDKIYFMDKFITHYQPWGAICEYGPGVENPEKIAKRKNLCWSKP